MRHQMFSLGIATIRETRLDKVLRHRACGLGTILMLHHVRPWRQRDFAPNRSLEITPEFLDEALTLVKDRGFEIIGMDEVPGRILSPQKNRPFVAITLDDGYRDNVEYALPVFKKHQAPFTVYVTTGFADATAPLWWGDLEQAIDTLDAIKLNINGSIFERNARNGREKTNTFCELYSKLRGGSENVLRQVIATLSAQAGINPLNSTKQLCLDWDGIRCLSQEPLATIGAHTITHPMLAKHDIAIVQEEIETGSAITERELGKTIKHFAYPVGNKTSAAGREFAVAKAAGFATAVTTRPGMLFPEHADHLHALPRLSVNGFFQNKLDLEVLLSGVPFAFHNYGRKLNVS